MVDQVSRSTRGNRAAYRRRSLTLVELLLALGLITLVCGMMFEFYNACLRSREFGMERMLDSQLARRIAMKIAEEVRGANGFVTSVGPGVTGDDRMITIQTVAMPAKSLFLRRSIKETPPPAECDVRQVQYYLAYDEDETYSYPDGKEAAAPLGLVRRELRTFFQTAVLENKTQSVELDLLAREMRYVRFRYFDGVDWTDRWEIGKEVEGKMGNSLPQAVEITVGYTALPPKEEEELDLEEDPDLIPSVPEPYSPETYTVTVRLPQADSFFGSRFMRAQRRSRLGLSSGGS